MYQPRPHLIRARKSKKLSQQAVAEGAKIDRKTLGHLEQGKSNPRSDTIELLCAYYQKSREELDLDKLVPTGEQQTRDEQLPESEPALVNPDTWYNQNEYSGFSQEVDAQMQPRQTSSLSPVAFNPVAPIDDISGLSLSIMSTRRQAMHEMVDGAIAILFFSPYALLPKESQERLTLAQIHPSYLDDGGLADLSNMTARYWRMVGNAPLDTLLGVAARHFESILQFLKDSHPTRIYNKLCALASENAQLLGRIFHLLKEYDLASRYYTFALKVALEVGQTDLWGTGVGRMAMLHLRSGNPSKGLPLLQEAQRMTLHDPRLRGWLPLVQAYVYAEMNNEHAYLRAIEQVKSMTVPASLDGDMYWTGFDSSLVTLFEGTCLISLRQPEKALPVLGQAITLAGPTRIHGYIEGTTDRAKAYAQLGDPKQACQLLSQVLDGVTQVRSLVHLQHVHEVRAELKPWGSSAEVQALDYQLDQATKALKQRITDS